MPPVQSSSHGKSLFQFSDRDKIIKRLMKGLKPHAREFDAIAVSGYSMALIAPIVAHRLKKNLIAVRKASENKHSSYTVEGPHNSRYIIIDDLIASGATIEYITKTINSDIGLENCKLVGSCFFFTHAKIESYESWMEQIVGYHVPVWIAEKVG